MKNIIIYCVILFNINVLFSFKCADKLAIHDLKVENLNNPLGIETKHPRFSWILNSQERGVYQIAYQIIVSSSEAKLKNNTGDLWNSGKIVSSETVLIPYAGRSLKSRQSCFWKVKVWTNKGQIVSIVNASWTMGLMEVSDWKAKWIGLETIEATGEERKSEYKPKNEDELRLKSNTQLNARYLRKELYINGNIKNASLYISGLGLYEAYINGQKIGNQVLSPTPTDYSKRTPYNTFDVTTLLSTGKNTLAVVLGNGRFFSMRIPWLRTFGLPKLLAQLEVTYKNGETKTYVSDESWKITINGPIGPNNEFDGEEYDARKEMPGWNYNDFNDTSWHQVELVNPPVGHLFAQENPNIKVMEILKPVKISKIDESKYIIDMGQNMAGWIKLTMRGKRGDRVTMRFAELLKPDGNLYIDNLRGARVTDVYTFKGEDAESWEPTFVYHGFRYVEIAGLNNEPVFDDIVGKVVYDEMETTGWIETSTPILNQIFKNSYWGIRGNYRGMPTDCPQRDERMGWLGDRATGAYGESFIFNNHKLYEKWLNDIEDSQREDGALPDVAPNYWEMYTNDVTWPAAYLIIAEMLYNQYGDDKPIKNHYQSFKRWLEYIQSRNGESHIITNDTFGDWCMPPESPELIHSKDPSRKTDGSLLSTAFYYRLIMLMQKFAEISGNNQDIDYYKNLSKKIKLEFNSKFYNAETKYYSNNTVTANLLALMHDLASDSIKADVFKHVVDKTNNEFNGHVSTGLIGIQWLMRGLSDYGNPELAYKIATNKDYPSWGYMIDKGATTVWELWNGDTADPAMNSTNHVMLLGDLIVWYYEYLSGIKAQTSGFKNILMKPLFLDGLKDVNANYNSVRGVIKSHWTKKDKNKLIWEVLIPCNTIATIFLPIGNEMTESGIKIDKIKEIKQIGIDNGFMVIEVKSGRYTFEIK